MIIRIMRGFFRNPVVGWLQELHYKAFPITLLIGRLPSESSVSDRYADKAEAKEEQGGWFGIGSVE